MKKYTVLLALAFSFTFLLSCKNDKKSEEGAMDETEMTSESPQKMEAKKVTVKMMPVGDSKSEGSVVFSEENGKVKMTAVFSGLEPGSHAIHIHENADCSSADGKAAGGHWNPTNAQHAKWGDEDGFHKGDIGNFMVDEKGNGTTSITTDEWCVGCDDANKNVMEHGVIVHQGTDDFTSQPSGNAGSRVSCGEIK